MKTERNKYVFKRYLNDGSQLKSFRIEFKTEEEAKENEQSASVDSLCAGLLSREMRCVIAFLQHVSDLSVLLYFVRYFPHCLHGP